jgi:hypothetical protein
MLRVEGVRLSCRWRRRLRSSDGFEGSWRGFGVGLLRVEKQIPFGNDKKGNDKKGE